MDPGGRLYAAGSRYGAAGGAFYLNDGVRGWRYANGPTGYPDLEFTALAADPAGAMWIAGNYSAGDSSQGALFQYDSGSFAPVGIRRISPGGYRIHSLAFDAVGHGWLAGDRSGGLPFIAGGSGGTWSEMLTEVEHEATEIPVSGTSLRGVCVLGAESAFAVGYAEVQDFEGLLENEGSIYELVVRPPGEIDGARRMVGPYAAIRGRMP
jgi:hypothetical protein